MSPPQSGPPGSNFMLPPVIRYLVLIALAIGIGAYTANGLMQDDVMLPMSLFGRRKFLDLHFHGLLAWLGAVGVAFVVLAIVVYIIQDIRMPMGGRSSRVLADKLAWIGMIFIGTLTGLQFFGIIK